MAKKQPTNKELLKQARAKFDARMKKKYPGFTEKKWAQATYRANHPQ